MVWKSELEDSLAAANARVLELEGTVCEQASQLATARTVGHIATAVEAELATPDMKATIEEDALGIATVAVITQERERLTTQLSASIRGERYDEIAAEFRIGQGAKILEGLRALFEADGTFDRIRESAQTDVRAALQGELMKLARADEEARLQLPDVRAAISAQLVEKIAASDELAEYRDRVRRESEERWAEEARQEVITAVEREEAGREEAFKADFASGYLASDRMVRYRDEKRRQHETEWIDATAERVAEQIDDEELRLLLTSKAELIEETMRREQAAAHLLQRFTGKGVDTLTIDEGVRMELFLGKIKPYTVQGKNDRYDRPTTVEKPGVECQRKLTLIALGEGRFLVDDDSLLHAASEYVRDDTLKRGTVIVVGRRISDNGDATLSKVIAADVPLYYDDDTEVPDITDARYPVANIMLDGVSAREVAHVEMVGVSEK